MKKIINGKLYNTKTATKTAEWDNNRSASDAHHYEEVLYKKRTGEFFIYGDGGALSRYARSCGGNSYSDGWDIIPLTIEEAQEWGEKKLDVDLYEVIFGEAKE